MALMDAMRASDVRRAQSEADAERYRQEQEEAAVRGPVELLRLVHKYSRGGQGLGEGEGLPTSPLRGASQSQGVCGVCVGVARIVCTAIGSRWGLPGVCGGCVLGGGGGWAEECACDATILWEELLCEGVPLCLARRILLG
jgi:hypothetical protein